MQRVRAPGCISRRSSRACLANLSLDPRLSRRRSRRASSLRVRASPRTNPTRRYVSRAARKIIRALTRSPSALRTIPWFVWARAISVSQFRLRKISSAFFNDSRRPRSYRCSQGPGRIQMHSRDFLRTVDGFLELEGMGGGVIAFFMEPELGIGHTREATTRKSADGSGSSCSSSSSR